MSKQQNLLHNPQLALMAAAKAGDITSITTLLIYSDINVNVTNADGDTALIIAAKG